MKAKGLGPLICLSISLLAGSVSAMNDDDGGFFGFSDNKIAHIAAYDTNCGEGIPPTSGHFVRRFNLKIFYNGEKRCDFDIWGNEQWRTGKCSSIDQNAGNYHTFELRHTVNRINTQWSNTVSRKGRNGMPRSIEITRTCGMRFNQ